MQSKLLAVKNCKKIKPSEIIMSSPNDDSHGQEIE